ncbi:MAG TPA: hypothetical protein VFH51_04175 [Myxococcota bacterium]|nr:hypothetical protein [Myxococcota bacterium]
MADNFISYNRFTTLPPNIADFGATVEELKAQKGTPDANPAASPMAAPRVSRKRLSLRPAGSDEMRLAEPMEPEPDPYEGPQPVLSLSRNAARKLAGNVLTDLEKQVQVHSLPDAETRGAMLDSFRRILAMREYLNERNQMTEGIYVRSIAASRG